MVDFDICIPPSCPAAQPLLPNSHQPKQRQADSGTLKIQVNKTQSQLTLDDTLACIDWYEYTPQYFALNALEMLLVRSVFQVTLIGIVAIVAGIRDGMLLKNLPTYSLLSC